MNEKGIYKLWERLPDPIKGILRPVLKPTFSPVIKNYQERLTYPLSGANKGHLMYGDMGKHLSGNPLEPEVAWFITKIVQPGWSCVDVGAHMGYFTLLMAKLVGEKGHVFAFEPHPGNFKKLRANVEINGYASRVRLENLAITDGRSERVTLFGNPDGSSCLWNIIGHDCFGKSNKPQFEVTGASLDDYFAHKAPPVNFIKMDIEGAEVLGLAGMVRILREIRPIILVEFHGDAQASQEALLAADYYLFDIENNRMWKQLHKEQLGPHCLATPTKLTCFEPMTCVVG